MGLGSRLVATALLLGGGALVVGLIVAGPTIMRTARPVLRGGIKRGLEAYDKARTAIAEFAEDVEDLVAEVRSDQDKPSEPENRGPRVVRG